MKVFISHASTDAQLARQVADALRASGFNVWDDTQVYPGENWAAQAAQALQESDAMVVLLTPDSLRSPNVNSEVGFALGQRSYKGRLIPVLVGSPEQLSLQDIPWILKQFQVIHLSAPEGDDNSLQQIVRALKEAA